MSNVQTIPNLCDDVFVNIIDLSLEHPTLISRLLEAKPDLRWHVERLCNKFSFEKLIRDNKCGLLYPKWVLGGSDTAPELYLLQNAAVLNNPNAFAAFHEFFRKRYRSICYKWMIEKCTELATRFDNCDVLRELYVNLSYQLSEGVIYSIYSEGSPEMISLLFNDLKKSPTLETFMNMIYENPHPLGNFLQFAPSNLPTKVIFLTYCICRSNTDYDELRFLEDALESTPPDEKLFSAEELHLYTTYSPVYVEEIETQKSVFPDYDFRRYLPIWKSLRYLWEYYDTYPYNFSLTTCFAEALCSRDLDCLEFLFETLGWEPEDVSVYSDMLFNDVNVARYVINQLNAESLEDEFKEVFGEYL